MWIYEKRLQYPVNITKTDARIAKIIASQYGGPDCNTLQFAVNPYTIGLPGGFLVNTKVKIQPILLLIVGNPVYD